MKAQKFEFMRNDVKCPISTLMQAVELTDRSAMLRATFFLCGILLIARSLVTGANTPGSADYWNAVAMADETFVTTQGCGTTKGCMHYPEGCQLPGNCIAVLTWQLSTTPTNFVDFEMMANTTGYVALGLSTDRSMVSERMFLKFY